MQPILQELSKQLQLLSQQQGESLQTACLTLKEQFWKQLPVIKKTVQSLLDGRDRKKIQQAGWAVMDARKEAESLAQAALDPIVQKLLKVERALNLADDILFGAEIHAGMSGAIRDAESAVAASKQAAAARVVDADILEQDQTHRLEARPRPPGR